MNTSSDFDHRASAWLADGPTELADHVLDAALREVHLTNQRRRLSTPWRTWLVNHGLGRAWVPIAVLAAIVGAGAIYVAGAGPNVVRPTDTPSPSPTNAPTVGVTPVSTIDLSTWRTFSSDQYEITIAHPAGWTEVPATRGWTFQDDAVLDPHSTAMDSFTAPDHDVRVSVWAIAGESLPKGPGEAIGSLESIYEWAEEFCRLTGNTPCDGVAQRALPMCLEYRDCHPATMVLYRDDVQAYFTGGGDSTEPGDFVYVVAVWRPDGDPSTEAFGGSALLLQAFLSTLNGGGNGAVWPMGYLPGGPSVLGTQAPASP